MTATDEQRRNDDAEPEISDRLATLLAVTNTLSQASSLHDLYRRAVALGRERLDFDRLSIWRISDDGESLLGTFGTDETGDVRDERASRQHRADLPFLADLLDGRRSLLQREDVPLLDHRGAVVGHGVQVLAALHDGRNVVGIVTADNLLSGRPIHEEQRRILALYASSLGRLCSLKRAEEELRRFNRELDQRVADRTRELEALYAITELSSQRLTMQTALEQILDIVLVAMQSGVGAIQLLDDEGEHLGMAAQRGIPPDCLAPLDPMPVHSGLPGWVVTHEETLVVTDLAADPRAMHLADATEFQRYLGAPVRARGRTLGVLSVLGQARQRWGVEDVALLSTIADQIGATVENIRLHAQSRQLAVLEERQRLARDLHDSLTHTLYSAALFAETGRQLLRKGALAESEQTMARVEETVLHALKEMRLLVHELRPSSLQERGLVEALRRRLALVEQRSGLSVHLEVAAPDKMPAPVEHCLYLVAQEALNNILRHAGAATVHIRLFQDRQQVVLSIEDDGSGFAPETEEDDRGLGLDSMRERAERLDGTLSVTSAPGQGTRLQVTVPIPAKKEVEEEAYHDPANPRPDR